MPRTLLCAALLLVLPASLPAADKLHLDFEQGGDPARLAALDLKRVTAEVVEGGADGRGHCLRIANPSPGSECGLAVKGPVEVSKNLILAFDYKADVEPGFDGTYLGMAFYVDGKQWFWTSDEFSRQWRHAEVSIPRLPANHDHVMRPGIVFSEIRLYGRVKDRVAGQRDKARMTVWFDNLRLYTGTLPTRVSPLARLSYANPPMFDWPRPAAGGKQKVQYALDPAFPAETTRTVELATNHYLPLEALEPGKWYWRVWTETDLVADWSAAEAVTIPPEAHRFKTAPVPDELARRPHPRLLPLARVEEPQVTAERRQQLVKKAEGIFKRGVPEHPGPHVPGDPRWPTWIDWYGKVAGNITGGTGRRLQSLGQCAMLTGDAKVIGWARDLALEACKWDPEGGSAMHLGDIGAHHLLRGLNWCYDACCDTLTSEQRTTLRSIIIQRARQFAGKLMPFRGSEANNHAWLQALALAESGIVLAGEHDEAADWAEDVRQLYLGRFLACLGYQGDNNEGISYWGYGLGFVVDYGDLMRSVCGIDIFRHPWLSQTARFPMYCAPPNAWAVSFADTGMPNHGTRGPAETRQVRDLAVRTRDPYALWYSGERKAVDGLEPKPPADLDPSIHYRHIGVVIFNTSLVDGNEGATLAMHSGQYFAGHQHPDQNSFVIHAFGEKLAIDGGYYDWYGSPHFKAYSMNTLAHNTLLVDGQGQAACTKGADGRIKRYVDSPGYGYVVGDAAQPEIYGGRLTQFDRRLLFIKPGFVVVHDIVTAAKPSARLDWLLHAVRPIETGAKERSFSIAADRAALHGRFLLPADAQMEVKTGFPVEPVNRYSTKPVPKELYFPEWTLHATPQEPAAHTEFLAVMQIQRRGEHADPPATIESVPAENAHGVRIRVGSATHIVLLRKPGATGRLSAEGLTTDGEAAAIERGSDGNIRRSLTIPAGEK